MTIAIVAASSLVVLAWHVGWFSAPLPWKQATGWDRIPAEWRPDPDDGTLLAASVPDRPRIDWLGHSGFLVRWRGVRILLDPDTSDRCTVSRRILERPVLAGQLGEIDAVLLSHAHYDHMDLPTLESIPRIDTVVLPTGADAFLSDRLRHDVRVSTLDPGQSTLIGPLEVVAVPAAHNGNRFHPLASRIQAVGYVVRFADDALYYSGDTGFDNPFAEIGTRYHPRLAILPIGAYSPRFPVGLYHLSPEEAVEAARALGVEAVIPCHFGTFTLSLDRPSSALPRFAKAAHERGVRWMVPRLLRAAPADPNGANVAFGVLGAAGEVEP